MAPRSTGYPAGGVRKRPRTWLVRVRCTGPAQHGEGLLDVLPGHTSCKARDRRPVLDHDHRWDFPNPQAIDQLRLNVGVHPADADTRPLLRLDAREHGLQPASDSRCCPGNQEYEDR